MKFRDDLQKWIYYHGQIDLGYYLLSEMSKEMNLPKHPLILAIDEATGASGDRFKNNKAAALKLIKDIIRQKKIYNYDTMIDEKFLSEIKLLTP